MVTTVNASTSSGLVNTADTSGIIKLQSNGVTTNALAWCNFNGIVTTSIRASYNISSVTRNGTGDYTFNFTNALTDANYAIVGSAQLALANYGLIFCPNYTTASTTSAFRAATVNVGSSFFDCGYVQVAVFGN
jgi:uncharacterized phosphosugar-binding protein